ncbi:MAG: tetratricopeptide repeat protein [Desulfuromonadales bacterium]
MKWIVLVAGILVISPHAAAAVPNSLYRVDVNPHKEYTRIAIKLASPPEYSLSVLPGNRLRLVIDNTDGPLLKKLRRYSDRNIGGLVLTRRDNRLLVTFQIAPQSGWRDLTRPDVSGITVDVGRGFKPPAPRPYVAGREKIWSGIEKLVRDFEPPIKSEIPFFPTDRKVLKTLLGDDDQKQFLAAEAALYKGQLTEAEEMFTRFAGATGPIVPLALYRLAETRYKLQKYPQALVSFREAEKQWPAYLSLNPGVTFFYGDSIARSGDLAAARVLLSRLVARLADKKYSPALLVRLGDIMTRQGHEHEAEAIYLNVAENFRDNKANQMALMRRADQEFLHTTPWNYRPVSEIYLNASRQGGDIDMREESLFKHSLLESLHGDAGDALQLATTFQKKFPRGVYAAVIRTIREVLVGEVYRTTTWNKDSAPALVHFAEEQRDFLGACVGQPGFLKTVIRAYNESGRPIELVKLLNSLVERQWARPVAPEMYIEIAEHAELIGDSATAENSIKAFLKKFPADSRARMMYERLGALYFAADKHQQVRETLQWLFNKGERAHQLDSYYRLGRSLWSLQQYPQAVKAMDLFLSGSGGRDPRLLVDAYFVAASAREAGNDYKGAIKMLDTALKLPDNPRSDEFMFKAGQLNLLAGNGSHARKLFDYVAKNSKDADWQRLSLQELASLDARKGTP